MDADAKCGYLLSGGLDSSLVCAIAQKHADHPIRTFSIGMETDAIDLKYARKVAAFIGSEHTEFIITKKDVLDALQKVIHVLGTWDITTIRASMGMYLLCKKIHESKLLPCNKSEIIGILETLAICGILETPEHKGYIHSFTPPLMRDTGDLRQSLSYPLNWWHGEDKVNYDNCYRIFNIDFSYLSGR